jgi:hypothetical protein
MTDGSSSPPMDRCAFCDRAAGMIVWRQHVLCGRCYALWIVERKDPAMLEAVLSHDREALDSGLSKCYKTIAATTGGEGVDT